MKTIGNEPITAIKDVGFNVETESIAFDPTKADFRVSFGGLTKREYFAALAMQGMLASLTGGRSNGWAPDKTQIVSYCKEAVQFADALIEELNKKSI